MSVAIKKLEQLVAQIPAGQVATYGQLAALLSFPHHARYVGRLLQQLPSQSCCPWHRVVNAQGKISSRIQYEGEDLQFFLLEQEGIVFKPNNRIDLKRFQWQADKPLS